MKAIYEWYDIYLTDAQKAKCKTYKDQKKLERERLEKYFDMVKAQTPGLSYKFLRASGTDNFGPEYEISHDDELTLKRAILKMGEIVGEDRYGLSKILANANEHVDKLSDAEVHNDFTDDEMRFFEK